MWCMCLFLRPPSPFHLAIPKHATPFQTPSVSLSATSLPRRRLLLDVSTAQQVGDVGHTLLATVQPNPIPKQQQQQQQERKQEEGDEAQLSGSDVLWALQRASSRKMKMKKKKKQRRESSSVATRREQTSVDYTNIPPLCIKTHWAAKLDELEKRLHDLSDNV